MAKISQRSLTEMMRVAQRFGLFETTSFGDAALVSPTEMSRRLYADDFPKAILDEFERLRWNFDVILPAIVDGTFGVRIRSNWRARAERISENQAEAEDLLRRIAVAFIHTAIYVNQKATYSPQVRTDDLWKSLQKDGFAFVGGQLVDAETQVINIPQQQTEFERTLNASSHDDKKTVRHHLKEAETFQATKQWGAAASEWRNIFEEVVRGAWRFTRANNPALATRVEKPPFRDVLLWLEQAGFFNADEDAAYGAAFGYLSAGAHPGIKEEMLAYLSRTLSLPLAHACLAKLKTWNGKTFI